MTVRIPQRTRGWVWAGRAVGLLVLAGLVVVLIRSGLDKASLIGSAVGGVAAVAAVLAPYLLPAPTPSTTPSAAPVAAQVENSGNATAKGGRANTGIQTPGTGGQVTNSGDAIACGPGAIANTGIQHPPAP